MRSTRSLMLVIFSAATLVFVGAGSAQAHEPRTFNGMDVEVGWVSEPPTTGALDGVVLIANDVKGHGLTGLDVSVEVTYQGLTLQKLPLEASDETPGHYSAAFIPTRPGEYDFHITGTAANGSAIDQVFKPGHGLEDVKDAVTIEFPAKDPPLGQLALQGQKLAARVDALRSSANSGKTLGLIGVIVGGLALLLSTAGFVRRRKGATP